MNNIYRSVYSQSLRESTPAGSLLMTVYADGASGIRYSLQDPCDSLAVHSVSGAIYLKNRLNREKHGVTVNCTVIARNTMGAESNARIVLKVIIAIDALFMQLPIHLSLIAIL